MLFAAAHTTPSALSHRISTRWKEIHSLDLCSKQSEVYALKVWLILKPLVIGGGSLNVQTVYFFNIMKIVAI
jgi:hypothetical protein